MAVCRDGVACRDSGQHVMQGWFELSQLGQELWHGQGWRCWWREEALWFILVLGALCQLVPQLGDPCLGTLSLRSPHGSLLFPCSSAPITLWERHPRPSPVPVNSDAGLAQRGQEGPRRAQAEEAVVQ